MMQATTLLSCTTRTGWKTEQLLIPTFIRKRCCMAIKHPIKTSVTPFRRKQIIYFKQFLIMAAEYDATRLYKNK